MQLTANLVSSSRLSCGFLTSAEIKPHEKTDQSSHNMKKGNIYIVGAQCTGKTTLVNRLDQHFHDNPPPAGPPAIIKEVARTVLVKHNFTANDITSSQERCLLLQRLILETQAKAEREVLGAGAEWFISDRSGVDPLAYAAQHVGEGAAEELMGSSDWIELRERMQGSLIVVCEAGASWLTDDGVRLMPASMEEWKAFHELFCRMLLRMGLDFVVLSSFVADLGERVEFVLREIEERARKS